MPDRIGDSRVTPGSLSAREARTLLGTDEPLILNVGANIGQTCAELFQAMPRATIYAFEPDPRAIAKFRRSVSHPRLHLFECAVGASNGSVTFYQSSGGEHLPGYEDGWDQSGSIRPPHAHLQFNPWVRFQRQLTVPLVTLDAWADSQGVEAVDLIWADVQGAEGDLIEGAARLLRHTAFFYTEYSNVEMYKGQITLDAMAEKLPDFELLRRYPHDVLFANTQYPQFHS